MWIQARIQCKLKQYTEKTSCHIGYSNKIGASGIWMPVFLRDRPSKTVVDKDKISCAWRMTIMNRYCESARRDAADRVRMKNGMGLWNPHSVSAHGIVCVPLFGSCIPTCSRLLACSTTKAACRQPTSNLLVWVCPLIMLFNDRGFKETLHWSRT
jgi:hypothetical protein